MAADARPTGIAMLGAGGRMGGAIVRVISEASDLKLAAAVEHAKSDHEPRNHQQADTAVFQPLPTNRRDQQSSKHGHAADYRDVAVVGFAATGPIDETRSRGHGAQRQEHGAGHEEGGNGGREYFHDRTDSVPQRP